MNEFKFEEKPASLEEKRQKKYQAKFGYRTNLISKKCPTGTMMGTRAVMTPKGQRQILKYLKIDEVGAAKQLPNTCHRLNLWTTKCQQLGR
jgi:hypothetical protein